MNPTPVRRSRNNLAKLPLEVRLRVCALLADGATYEQVRDDSTVSDALTAAGVAIHGSTFQAYIASEEYQGYIEAKRAFACDIDRRRITAALVDAEDAPSDLAKVAQFSLLNGIVARLDSGDDLSAKDLASLSGAIKNYFALKQKADHEKMVADYQAQISALSAQVETLSAEKAQSVRGLSAETLAAIEEKVGLL